MSILIKSMSMPNGCKDCIFVKRGSVYDICPLLRVPVDDDVEFGGSPSNCPLISIPPHGRLIDADAAVKQGWTISRTYSASPNEMVYEVKTMDDEVLPTIIPADESDMDSFIHIFEEDEEEDGMDSFIRILKD